MKKSFCFLCFAAFLATTLLGRGAGLIVVDDLSGLDETPRTGAFPPRPLPPRPYQPHRLRSLEISSMRAEVKITDQLAVTVINEAFFNPNPQRLEGTFLFPVPNGAQLKGFTMEIGGKPVEAELVSADKARGLYEEIVRKARDPALLEYAGRDLFKVRIFPIEPNSRKHITLTYSQLLHSDGGLINYVYPLNTEKFSSRPIDTVSVKVELISTSPLKAIYSPSHQVDIRRENSRSAIISLEAAHSRPETDFQLYFSREKGDLGLNVMTYPGKDKGGGSYFLLLASPAFDLRRNQVMLKDVIFLLDTSGSMAGPKLEQAKKALQYCVNSLNDQDRFEVIRFSTDTESLFDHLAPASLENRGRASDFVHEFRAMGGTAIDDALKKALALRPADSNRPYYLVFLTDGLPTVGNTDEDQIVANVKQASGGNTRVFCFGIGNDVNTRLLDRIAETTRASSQYVLPEEDLEVKVSSFFTKVNQPALTNIKLSFPPGMHASQIVPHPFPDLFKGEQLVIAGRFSGTPNGKVTLEGSFDGQPQRFEAGFAAEPQEFIPRLWATRRVGYLLDEIRLHGENQELREEITDLARQYGIVTPYTAYFIMEDETQRHVPLALQSLPSSGNYAPAEQRLSRAWDRYRREPSGGEAVASARSTLALKAANTPAQAIEFANSEAERGFAFFGLADADPAGRTAGLGGLEPEVDRQEVRYVQGRSFFQHGDQWIDSAVQKLEGAKHIKLKFGGVEYFELAAKYREILPWLALGTKIQFALNDTIYEVLE